MVSFGWTDGVHGATRIGSGVVAEDQVLPA